MVDSRRSGAWLCAVLLTLAPAAADQPAPRGASASASAADALRPPRAWRFVAGGRSERLRAAAADMPAGGVEVTLPHRIDMPDTALWYSAEVDWPRRQALEIDADDGAQVFVAGVQVPARRRWHTLPADVPAGRHPVIVRVLNNAMAGGLRRVAFVPVDDVPPEPTGPGGPAPNHLRPDSATFAARLPASPAPCRFTLWADSQSGWEAFARVADRLAREPVHFSAGIGDLVADGSDAVAWRRFVEMTQPLRDRAPFVPVPGNHDYDGFYDDLRSRHWHQWFGDELQRDRTWSAWSCGPARFVTLDLNQEFPIGLGAGSSQRLWLESEVGSPAWRTAAWRVLLVHQPAWSRAWPGYEGDRVVQDLVAWLAGTHGLQVVVSGHTHAYEHLVREAAGRTVHQIVTGGAGGGLEPPWTSPSGIDRVVVRHHYLRGVATVNGITIEAVGLDGAVFDRVVVR